MRFIGHSQDLAAALPLIERTQSPYWVAIDPDPESARRCAELGVKLIVRHYRQDWDSGEPEKVITPLAFVEACISQPWARYAWAVETPNEPHPGDTGWMAEVVRLFRLTSQLEVVVGNWGTGWSGFYVPGATYYGAHCYGWPDVLSQQPWHALRYRSWVPAVLQQNPAAKLFITECGVTQAVLGRQDVGWRSDGRNAAAYAESLSQYAIALAKDPYVLAAAIYQFGGNPDWSSFEGLHEPALEALLLPPSGLTPPTAVTTRLHLEIPMARPSEVQASIDFLNGLAAVFAKGRNIKRAEKAAWAEQARFVRDWLEAAYPLP